MCIIFVVQISPREPFSWSQYPFKCVCLLLILFPYLLGPKTWFTLSVSLSFFNFYFILLYIYIFFYFTILHWFCHTSLVIFSQLVFCLSSTLNRQCWNQSNYFPSLILNLDLQALVEKITKSLILVSEDLCFRLHLPNPPWFLENFLYVPE